MPIPSSRRAFTLIEILVVIAIIVVLSVVVVMLLNPAEIVRQARDSTRVSDVDTIVHALSVYQVNGKSSFLSRNLHRKR